ncbi:hypothetical protein [Sphingosinicella sp. BN140058]|uniref:hypothetical protein n=1 Tax=Sphingosinicella sp. BN140058 TaxID=1892855 RepID=UPI0010101EBD|nr:hypothetical protein [Sphingosinicella sp. BN140058]QAY80171.1 hypothetical protein ETR14_26370 [Sphingosinicella sp. BN140058]
MREYQFSASGGGKQRDLAFDAVGDDAACAHVDAEMASDPTPYSKGVLTAEGTTVGYRNMRNGGWIMGDVHFDDRPSFRGYSNRQLREAFTSIQNETHWKDAIDKVVPPDANLDLLAASAIFMAGTVLETEVVADGIRVTGAGYWACIGA